MSKRIVLAKLFSGASALTVAVSGVSAASLLSVNASNEVSSAVQDTMKSLSVMFDSISNVMDGNSEFAYNANLNLKLSETEFEVKPIDISAVIQQKNRKTSADLNVMYDSKSAVTLNAVYDHENEIAYLKVPEINNAYLSVKEDELYNFGELINALFPSDDYEDDYNYDDDYNYGDDSEYDDDYDDSDYEDIGYEDLNIENILSILESVDLEALEQDIADYLELIETKVTCVDGEPLTGSINDYDYSLASKVYNITGQDFQNIVNAVADKAKNDSLLKSIAGQIGLTENDYLEMINEIVEEVNDMRPSELAEKMVVTVYLDGETVVGLGVKDSETETHDIIIANENFIGIDQFYADEYNKNSVIGGLSVNGNKINGSFNDVTSYADNTYTSEKTTLENVSFDNGVFTGVIKIENEDNIYEEEGLNKSTKIITSNSTSDKLDITLTQSDNGKETLSMTLTGEKTVPTDIQIPTENVYSMGNIQDIAEFAASSDLDGFMMNLKNVLGDELFELLFGEMSFDPDIDSDPKTDPGNDSNVADSGVVTVKKPSSDSKDSNSNANNDKSPNTGAVTGVSLAAVLLAGISVVITKKK